MIETVVEHKIKHITLGIISAVYGVKGWVKIHSYTSPVENILNYKRWMIHRNDTIELVNIDQSRRHGKGLVAHIVDCNDRELAKRYCNSEIMVNADEMPDTSDDDIYWHQLEGLSVFFHDKAGNGVLLGTINYLMHTGANDVAVISPIEGSLDKRERLIPWLIGTVVLEVNSDKKFIRVDWDPEF